VDESSRPVGRVIVSVLGALARGGNELRDVVQAADGCALHAAIPSSMWHWAGDLVVLVRRTSPEKTSIEARTKIRGQMFDWGKSNARLTELLNDVHRFASEEYVIA
jgi:hypothetical protein